MATTFPTTLDAYTDLSCASTDSPKDRVNDVQDAIEAIEARVGITGSPTTTTHAYKLSGVVSTDKAASLAGTEALTNKTLTSPKINEAVDLTSTATELNFNDGSIAGTSVASKTLVLGATLNTNNLVIDNALKFNFPQGYMVNGQTVVSVTSNNITFALKTNAGADATASDPIHVKIGNTIRTITTAVSATRNAGTNWCNSGATILAAQVVPYFVYLAWDSSNSLVRIAASRIPYAVTYADFNATTTDERHGMFSVAPSSADEVTVIGRFLATLSATASFNWSVTSAGSVVNRPIYESDRMIWIPSPAGWSGTPTVVARYRVFSKSMAIELSISGTSNATTATATMPFVNRNGVPSYGFSYASDNGGNNMATYSVNVSSANMDSYRVNGAAAGVAITTTGTFTTSGTKAISPNLTYEI